MIIYEALLEAAKSDGLAGEIYKDTLSKYAYLDKQQRAFIHCMLEGVTERRLTLAYVIDSVSTMPVSKLKKPVRILLEMGAYQILYMDSVPDRAAVNETVLIAKKKHLGNLAGFINGVLRSISRLEGHIDYPKRDKDVTGYLSVYYSMPELIVRRLIADYGESECEEILKACLAKSPVYARVNTSRTDLETLIGRLNEYPAVEAAPVSGMDAVRFDKMDSLSDINEFSEGLFTIQDLSSQLLGRVAGIKKGDTVLDVCASPGGKSLNAADILSGSGKVIACDISDEKITRIKENAQRCGFLNISARVMDASVYNEELCECADVLICDVPCSGLGVMGRKNDIRYSISDEKLLSLDELQKKILSNTVKYLKPGGILIFSTCTILKAENIGNYEYIRDELKLTPVPFNDELPENFGCESAKEGYIQLLPGKLDTDGFFIAKFRR